MARQVWTLTDVDRDIYVDQISISPQNVAGIATGYRIGKRRLRGGLSDGVDMIVVDNGTLRMSILPTRGMGIWRAARGAFQLGWRSPVRGPVHPGYVNLDEPNGIGWLRGFDEFLVRCGLESNGAPEFDEKGNLVRGLHGRIANVPAHRVEVAVDEETGELSVEGEMDESRLFGNCLRLKVKYVTWVGDPTIRIIDTVTNAWGQPARFQLLYHINVGVPFLEPGAQVEIPFECMAPRDASSARNVGEWNRFGPPQPGAAEDAFYFRPLADASGESLALLRNAACDTAMGIGFRPDQLPCFTLWKNPGAPSDGYVTGLEPGTNYPNPHSSETARGRVVTLAPGESRSFEMKLAAFTSSKEVRQAMERVAGIHGTTMGRVIEAPHPEWA